MQIAPTMKEGCYAQQNLFGNPANPWGTRDTAFFAKTSTMKERCNDLETPLKTHKSYSVFRTAPSLYILEESVCGQLELKKK